MQGLLNHTIGRVVELSPKHGRRLQAAAAREGEPYWQQADEFLGRFKTFIEKGGKTFDYGIECYLKLRNTMAEERLSFLREGRYSNQSFSDVAERVYLNPEVMQYHMYGLVFAQFLWAEQYRRFLMFRENLPAYLNGPGNYLEIGGGHGLYAGEALRVLPAGSHVDIVDVSPSSIELAKGMLPDAKVDWHLADIFKFEPGYLYQFITVGEVLEHVEDPFAMLRRIHGLLAPGGAAYITTPANAPMVDHIYLFNSAAEIRAMLERAGFAIQQEATMYSEEMPPERAEELKLPLMYAAFVRPV